MAYLSGVVINGSGGDSSSDVPVWVSDAFHQAVQFCHTNPIAAAIVGVIAAGIAVMLIFAILLDL